MVIKSFAIVAFCMASAFASTTEAQMVKKITKYEIKVNDNLYVPFSKSSKGYFEKGFPTGYGSGIAFKGVDPKGSLQFYAITDRGPNADAPFYVENGTNSPSKIFPAPKFIPSIGIVTLKDGKAFIDSDIKIKDRSGKEISGLPLSAGLVGSTGEVALDADFNKLGYDNEGVDSEGIALDKDGNMWICDEYGPFLIKMDKNGKILKKYAPTQGLPDVLKNRIPNRGFEGVSVSPSGNIFAVVQSVLDIDGKTNKTATFSRIVEFNPKTEKTKMYMYPINESDYKSAKNAKIGDVFAVSDKVLLIIEQGELKDKTMGNRIYRVDISKATDISNAKVDGKELEFVADRSLLKEFTFAKKEMVVDLRANGWTAEKAEGIYLINNKSIVLINDNDFGVTLSVEDKRLADPKITNYTYNADKKEFVYKSTGDPKISLLENTEPAEVWIIEMDKAIQP